MAWPIGNEFYKLRKTDGRPKKHTPETIEEAFNDYADWVQDNQFKEAVLSHKTQKIVALPKMRPMTIDGFCIFAGITRDTFLDYEKQKDFSEVISRVRMIIEDFQFSGAASGFLNPNIIARKLGLSDKQDVTFREQPLLSKHKGKDNN